MKSYKSYYEGLCVEISELFEMLAHTQDLKMMSSIYTQINLLEEELDSFLRGCHIPQDENED